MSSSKNMDRNLHVPARQEPFNRSRRRFLGYAGMAAGIAVIGSACNKDDDGNMMEGGVDLGSGDGGVLNYAYALEQLEAAFYTQLVASAGFSTMFNADERMLLTDIRDHEIAHREFFKVALGNGAIQSLEVNFSSIDFSSKTSVLNTAKTFEDLGVSAYNGAGNLLTNPDFLELAGKIVSVEARHAAYVRDLISNGTFSDSTDQNGMDVHMMPKDVVALANNFLTTKVNANKLV